MMVRAEENLALIKQLSALVPQLEVAADDPDANDDVDNYRVGCIWVNTTDDGVFICTDNSDGAAVWREITFV